MKVLLLGLVAFSMAFAAPGNGFRQVDTTPPPGKLVEELQNAYDAFDYEKSAELLTIAFRYIDRFPPQERIEVYKYAGFIAYQKGNVTLSSSHFWKILEIDPSYSLDPISTPPKLLTLFQKTKIEFLQDLNERLNRLRSGNGSRNFPWRAFLFPGWEQWHRGYRTRGILLATTGLGLSAGWIYSALMAEKKKDEYVGASNPAQISALYDSYNSHYRRQYYIGYAFAALWLLSQADLTLWSREKLSVNASVELSAIPGGPPTAVIKISLLSLP